MKHGSRNPRAQFIALRIADWKCSFFPFGFRHVKLSKIRIPLFFSFYFFPIVFFVISFIFFVIIFFFTFF